RARLGERRSDVEPQLEAAHAAQVLADDLRTGPLVLEQQDADRVRKLGGARRQKHASSLWEDTPVQLPGMIPGSSRRQKSAMSRGRVHQTRSFFVWSRQWRRAARSRRRRKGWPKP